MRYPVTGHYWIIQVVNNLIHMHETRITNLINLARAYGIELEARLS